MSSLTPNEILEEFPRQYQQTWEQFQNFLKEQPHLSESDFEQLLTRFRMINHQIQSVMQDLEAFSINLDQNAHHQSLTRVQEQAIEEFYERDRFFDQLKPFIALVSLANLLTK